LTADVRDRAARPWHRLGAMRVAVALFACAVLATFLLAGAHQHRQATRQLDAANAAFVQRQWEAAADDAHAAALRAWPRSAVQSEAFAVLERTARSAQAAGDTRAALVAWSDMHDAAIATRSVLTDTTPWERMANDGARALGTGVVTEAVPPPGGGRPSEGLRWLVAAAVLAAAAGVVWLTRARAVRS
jgi:hypothetical protein